MGMQAPEQRPERDTDQAPGGANDTKALRRPKRRPHRERRQPSNAKSQKAALEHPAGVCARLASGHNGIVTHAQLRHAGLTPGEIKQLIRAGILHRLYRGVYAVGHLALAPLAREQAALFACGRGSVISHRSAAYLWALTDERPSTTEVTLARRHCRQQDGLRVRHVARLSSADVRSKGAIRLTSPARTIVDLAAEADDGELERIIAEARARRLLREHGFPSRRSTGAWPATRWTSYGPSTGWFSRSTATPSTVTAERSNGTGVRRWRSRTRVIT